MKALPTTALAAAAAAVLASGCTGGGRDGDRPATSVTILAAEREEFQNYGEVKAVESGSVDEFRGSRRTGCISSWRLEWPSDGCGLAPEALARARSDLANILLAPLSGAVPLSTLPRSPSAQDAIARIIEASSIAADDSAGGPVRNLRYSARTAVSWPFGLPAKNSVSAAEPQWGPVLGISGIVEWRTLDSIRGESRSFAFNYSIPGGRPLRLADYIKPASIADFSAELERRWRATAGSAAISGGPEGFLVEGDGLSWSDDSAANYLKLSWEELEQWLR